jgi:O-antigen/teichoic acid export membrane protein
MSGDGSTPERISFPDDTSTATMAREGSIAFGGNLVKKVFGFAIVAVITRLVSPSVYGLFILATSIILFVQAFANLGLPEAIDYFVPQHLSDDEHGEARGVFVAVAAIMLTSPSSVSAISISTRVSPLVDSMVGRLMVSSWKGAGSRARSSARDFERDRARANRP